MTESIVPSLRVLDLTDAMGRYAPRLFVGMGAEVIRLVEGATPCSAADLHWRAGVHVVEGHCEDIRATAERLLRDADVVLESGPRRDLRTTVWRAEDSASWADVVHVVITPFGLEGPRRDWLADDTVAAAAGGMTWMGGPAGAAPTCPPHEQAFHLAGANAAIAALLGLVVRQRGRGGQLIDVSAQECVAATLETGAISWIHAGTVTHRSGGVYSHVAHRIFPATDGYLAGGYSGSNRMWTDLLSWMDETGEAGDLVEPVWADQLHRWAGRAYVDEVVARFSGSRPAGPFAEEARRRALPWAEVVPASAIGRNPQLRSRQFFTEIHTADGATTEDVGFPFESPSLCRPARLECRTSAPAADVAWGDDHSHHIRPEPTEDLPPLAGMRVLDLTWVLAGPYATKILADQGADVIKVESQHRQDPTRFAASMRLRPEATSEESAYFLNFNRNKRSIALNLRTPEAVRVLQELAATCDVVVENFSPGTLEKWGLGYKQLALLNPDVILVSMSGVGHNGPWQNAVTFADTLAAMAGFSAETGPPGGAPEGFTFGLGDMIAGNAAALATLERWFLGLGGHVDLSQLETMAACLGPAYLTAESPAPLMLPGVFRSAGDDCWLAIGGTDGNTLEVVAEVVGSGTADDLAERISTWAACRSASDAAQLLQDAGVPAYEVQNGRDLVESDPQMAARGFYVPLAHPVLGEVLHEGVVHRLRQTRLSMDRVAPLLGEHTHEVLVEFLGLDDDAIDTLQKTGALE